ncbi:CU044_5270 family protein [Actinoallomurus bryophytorum]|nr:CU044_5270 family protein [Actinoallomurus bryophytorum]
MEDQLAEAMRRTAGTIEPRVTELVTGGIARGRRRRLRNRVGAASAVAAVTAAAVAAGVLTIGAADGTGTSQPPAVRLVSATEVLGRAAQAMEVRPESRPRPDQWLYVKTLEVGVAAEHGMHPTAGENWTRFDGAREAGIYNGKLVIERKAGAASAEARLASLPADPQALRAKIYKEVDASARRDWQYPDRDGEAFDTIAQLLWSNPVGIPPKTQAAFYRVLATIPGVGIDKNVKDGASRPAIAVTHGYGEQFLLDPATYQVVAQRTVFNGHNAPISKATGTDPRYEVPVGTVTYSLTRLTAKVVDKPGQR